MNYICGILLNGDILLMGLLQFKVLALAGISLDKITTNDCRITRVTSLTCRNLTTVYVFAFVRNH